MVCVEEAAVGLVDAVAAAAALPVSGAPTRKAEAAIWASVATESSSRCSSCEAAEFEVCATAVGAVACGGGGGVWLNVSARNSSSAASCWVFWG